MNDPQSGAPAVVAPMSKILQWIAGIAGGVGTLVPGASFFTQQAPPLFAPVGLLTSAAAVAVLIRRYLQAPHGTRTMKTVARLIVLSLVLAGAYVFALDYLTVLPPSGRPGPRVQIGFGMAPWSLTPEALGLVADPKLDLKTPQDLMLAFGAYPGGSGTTSQIWRPWTIGTSGGLLIALFLCGFICLASGFGTLAGLLSKSRK